MADNLVLNPGTGGATLASDEISLIHHQLVKIEFGAADSATMVSTTNALPVDLRTNNLSGNINVAVAAALPTGANTIGNVGVVSVVPGVTPTALGKAEDDPHATGDVGVQLLAVRTDTPANRSTTDGDYEPLQVSAGRLWTSTLLTSSIPAGGNNIGDVDIATMPDEGQQTMAQSISVAIASNQSAVPVSDGGGSLTVDGTVSVSGTVTVTGSVTANAGTNLNTSALALEGGGNLATIAGAIRAEDAASATAHTGIVALAVRKAAPANTSDTDGDYEALQVSAGRLWVDPSGVTLTVAAHAVTNAGTFAVQESGAALTALQLIDDPVFADDIGFTAATSKVMAVGYRFDDAATDSVDEDDIGIARMSANRNIYMQIRDLTAERSAAVTATNALKVDNSAVTQPVSGTITANAGTGNFVTTGEVNHDSSDSGAPQKIGAQARQTWMTPVADADRANVVCDDLGRLVTYPYAPRDRVLTNRIVLTSTAETTLIAAGGAGVFRDLLSLDISNESSSECRVDIRSATAGTVVWSIDLAADGGGIAKTWPLPFPQATAANNWTATLSAAVSSVYLTAMAVEQP